MEGTEPTWMGDNDGKTTLKIMKTKKFKFFRGNEKKDLNGAQFVSPGIYTREANYALDRNIQYTQPTSVTASGGVPVIYFFSGVTANQIDL